MSTRAADSNITLDIIEVQDRFVAVYNPDQQYNMPPPGVLHTDAEPTPSATPRQLKTGWRWAHWGKDDRWPTNIRLKIEAVPMAGMAINRLVKLLYGNGIAYYRNRDVVDGATTVSRAKIPTVEAFLTRNRIHTEYLPNMFHDGMFTWNAFCELIFSTDRRAITGIFRKEAEHCRLAEQDPVALRNLFLLYSQDFAYQTPEESRIARIPLYQWDIEEQFLSALPGYKMAWHIRHTGSGIHYARPFWLGLFRDNGWMDAAVRVPETVNAMMKNQITLKYQVLIPEDYFRIRHQNWDTYTDDQRNDVIDKKIKEFNAALKGEKNTFMSVASVFKQNEISGAPIGKIEIIAIDDKLKKDAWVPTSEIADAQIVQGFGVHPSQVGLAPQGGKMGAGSGSDQRETYNLGISLNNIEQQQILEPLNWLARYNARYNADWDVTFFIDHTHHTTTNDQESGLKPSETTLEIK